MSTTFDDLFTAAEQAWAPRVIDVRTMALARQSSRLADALAALAAVGVRCRLFDVVPPEPAMPLLKAEAFVDGDLTGAVRPYSRGSEDSRIEAMRLLADDLEQLAFDCVP